MATAEEFGAFFGYAGMVMTFVYFLSPLPTCINVHKSKDVQEFSVFPPLSCEVFFLYSQLMFARFFQVQQYAVGVVNCSLWVYWAIVTMQISSDNLTPNLLINGIGLFQFVAYVSIFMVYAKSRTREFLRLIMALLLFEVILILSFEGIVPRFGDGKLKSRVSGLVTDVLNILLYGSPLIVMRKVIRTKSVKYMPLPMSVLTLVICILWSTQAIFISNMTVLVPNAVGTLLGVAQLILYARRAPSLAQIAQDGHDATFNQEPPSEQQHNYMRTADPPAAAKTRTRVPRCSVPLSDARVSAVLLHLRSSKSCHWAMDQTL
ncbi:Bidirectional sugar transporter SWEET6b [Symbiodinium microadriaticum]|uniref:Sugar transporter SWEET1 n=1 Tax=Symbiodinium microadriaticum TaxID=2951 RepID=A0A1Q9DS40_SYMMI|nr:Bidirectional sugar transporter SWEET6b [Symbiodinium microadriaticum]